MITSEPNLSHADHISGLTRSLSEAFPEEEYCSYPKDPCFSPNQTPLFTSLSSYPITPPIPHHYQSQYARPPNPIPNREQRKPLQAKGEKMCSSERNQQIDYVKLRESRNTSHKNGNTISNVQPYKQTMPQQLQSSLLKSLNDSSKQLEFTDPKYMRSLIQQVTHQSVPYCDSMLNPTFTPNEQSTNSCRALVLYRDKSYYNIPPITPDAEDDSYSEEMLIDSPQSTSEENPHLLS